MDQWARWFGVFSRTVKSGYTGMTCCNKPVNIAIVRELLDLQLMSVKSNQDEQICRSR